MLWERRKRGSAAMLGVDGSTPIDRRGFTIGYDLGTVGTWVRILVGVVASVALVTIDLSSSGPAANFFWETSLWFLGLLGAYTVVYVLLAPNVMSRLNPWVSTVIFYGPVLVLPYIDTLPDAFRIALALYIILSIAVVVFVRYGGCEVVGIPALIVRRRHVVYCPWNTVDIVDKAIEDSRWSQHLQGISVKVVSTVFVIGVLVGGSYLLGEAAPLAWGLTAAASVVVVALWVVFSASGSKSERSTE
jgi:hypothetical protein